MGTGYLADTNTIIDYLENRLPKDSIELIDRINIQFSVITRIELLVWPKASDKQIIILRDFIAASTVLDLTENTILHTIEIRKNFRLKLPDAIIAATALANNLTLITRNLSDFEKVAELNSINPYNL
jgi:predicted nucleic acid-binding protein